MRAHSAATKARALSLILQGHSDQQVADELGIPRTSVKNWRGNVADETLAEISQKKTRDFGELIEGYLCENLLTLKAQTEHFRDKDWLNGQDAAGLAVLHGVVADKAIRILEAVEQANADEE